MAINTLRTLVAYVGHRVILGHLVILMPPTVVSRGRCVGKLSARASNSEAFCRPISLTMVVTVHLLNENRQQIDHLRLHLRPLDSSDVSRMHLERKIM